ncbi:inositol-pentakisphosphate 2-kinase [Rhypophila decipiens]|uniref:Inositol-pentakisphosphate 2-kinase n=1 Tax=Rhypophila decipiens TaxID=261697 RepID=A0AAN7B9E7_9PEZI|nr:inositol-pentakisphosphate 2-kinase [Rhypophila decipiens]
MSTPSTIPDLAALLADDFDFKFVGEGAANIIFEIIQSQEPDPLLHDKLLRVPKARAIALDYLHVQEYWESSVRPLFQDGDLVNQVLVHLGACSAKQNLIISRMQAAVSSVEPTRRKDFRGSTVGETEYAMLVDDMRAARSNIKGGGGFEILLEFKPKWLTQSPDAPANAIRCRNCAKEWLRYHDKLQKKLQKPPKLQQSFTPDDKLQRRQTQKALPLPVLCTIDLLNSSSCIKARERVLSRLTDPSPTSRSTVALTNAIPEGSRQWRLLSRWLEGNSLLKRLELAQRANDDPEHLDRNGRGKRKRGGCLTALVGQENPELDLAMTLRDCTCFLRIPGPPGPPPLERAGAGGPAEEDDDDDDEQGEAAATEQDVEEESVEVEAKLGDLDKKNGAAKLATWQALERRLIDEGFYTKRRPRAEWTCALERTDEDEDED